MFEGFTQEMTDTGEATIAVWLAEISQPALVRSSPAGAAGEAADPDFTNLR